MEGLPWYRGKIELSPLEFLSVKPILRNMFPLVERPEYVRKKDWDHFLSATLGLNHRPDS
jgi:hypothetical protein